jgi:hypothetical protein
MLGERCWESSLQVGAQTVRNCIMTLLLQLGATLQRVSDSIKIVREAYCEPGGKDAGSATRMREMQATTKSPNRGKPGAQPRKARWRLVIFYVYSHGIHLHDLRNCTVQPM